MSCVSCQCIFLLKQKKGKRSVSVSRRTLGSVAPCGVPIGVAVQCIGLKTVSGTHICQSCFSKVSRVFTAQKTLESAKNDLNAYVEEANPQPSTSGRKRETSSTTDASVKRQRTRVGILSRYWYDIAYM